MNTTNPTKRILSEKWKAYSGMSAAFMAIASGTQAQVIYTDVDPDAVLDESSFAIDFDGDGTVDVSVEHELSIVGAFSSVDILYARASGSLIAPINSYGYYWPSMLVGGSVIDPSDPNWSLVSGALLGINNNSIVGGPWLGHTAYMGCRFVSGLGSTHYAWVQLSVDPIVESMTILGYAYEATPQAAILAGDQVGGTIGMPDLTGPQHLEVYPNPSRGPMTLRLGDGVEGHVLIQVLDGIGRALQRSELHVTQGVRTTDLDLSELPPGTYFVSVRIGERVMHRKVTKVD